MSQSLANAARRSEAVEVKDPSLPYDRSVLSASSRSEPRVARIAALDFTKGMLVLLMVLYHWINYFVSREGDFYRFLRFITPSFIFITGFLIANVYVVKYDLRDSRVYWRLLQRGIKLLALFTLLNLVTAVLSGGGARAGGAALTAFLQDAGSTYLIGNGRTAAFVVLVPISYLLVLAPVLLVLYRWQRWMPDFICGLAFLALYLLGRKGILNGHLELLAIGLLGVVLGRISIEKINKVARRWMPLLAAYGAYLLALVFWREIYPLQVFGVCLSLLLIYSIHVNGNGARSWISPRIVLLGKYSLFAYIAQIGVILLLAQIIARGDPNWLTLSLSFLGAYALTWASVETAQRLRTRSIVADRLYQAVFG